jgi:hypothetical protein
LRGVSYTLNEVCQAHYNGYVKYTAFGVNSTPKYVVCITHPNKWCVEHSKLGVRIEFAVAHLI